MVASRKGAAVVDAGGNSLLSVTRSGDVALIATFPTREEPAPDIPGGPPAGTPIPSQSVPTSVAVAKGGAFLVGELRGFPFPVGGADLYRVAGGEPTVVAEGFTNVIDVEVGPHGTWYVLELASDGLLAAGESGLPMGRLLRVTPDGGDPVVVADDLPAPGGVAIRKGRAYVTVNSVLPGEGQVLAVPLT